MLYFNIEYQIRKTASDAKPSVGMTISHRGKSESFPVPAKEVPWTSRTFQSPKPSTKVGPR